jgi:aspartyl-tRNA(Asn)/glutamyl-tRNA(Gln) amidotransferase subunit A
MTRTVADAALLMSVLAGPDPRDRHSLPAGDVDWLGAVADSTTGTAGAGVAGLRVAFSPDLGYLAVDPEVREIAARAAAVFEKDLGCVVEPGDPGWSDPFEAFWSLVVADTDLACGLSPTRTGRPCHRTWWRCCAGHGRRSSSPRPA